MTANLPQNSGLDFDLDDFTELLDVLRVYQQNLNDFGLNISGLAVSRVIKVLEDAPTKAKNGRIVKEFDAPRIIKLRGTSEQAANRIPDEAKNATMFVLDPRFSKLVKQENHFGDKVFERFVECNDDIAEAAACIAVERGTACVMHLMRVLESGLKALAQELGIGEQKDWGSYLREIEKELKARIAQTKARSAKEQFYSEATTSIDAMKRAWRNPTMHPDKSYGVDRAYEIFESVKSFMNLLAAELPAPASNGP